MAPMGRLAALLMGVVLRAEGLAGPGDDKCPCIDPYNHPRTKEGMTGEVNGAGQVQYTSPSKGETYTFPTSWGKNCAAHDNDLAPYCNDDKSPAWCEAEWCYVLHDNCDGITNVKAKWLSLDGLYFSYATCRGSGGSGETSPDPWDDEATDATRLLIAQVDSYARGATHILEEFAKQGTTRACTLGSNEDMCPCTSCVDNSHWDSWVDLFEVGIKKGHGGTTQQQNHAVCMAEEVANTYQAVAAKEMDADFQKVGYMYFGEADSGGYAQYPKEDYTKGGSSGSTNTCDTDSEYYFDPRYRPWYAGGATGPKDVIMLIDASGSMNTAGRWAKAKEAAKLVVETLSWKDFVTIILFDSRVPSNQVYGDGLMVPATEGNKLELHRWIDGGSSTDWASGGTNFKAGFDKVWEVLAASFEAKTYSMCQKLIMFMTDGEDGNFGDDDFAEVQRKAIEEDAFILTYALGSGADHEKPKRLACENRGIFYPVSDDMELDSVMARYFDFFAQGQEICNANFVKYSHAHTSSTLYGACMPMYDRSDPSRRDLLGVSCIDVNLLKDLQEMKSQPGWNHFLCQATDVTKACRSLDLSDCHLQKARRAFSTESVCSTGDDYSSVSCPCQSPSCQDDPEFTDAMKYFCDTWIGDDCNDDSRWAKFGYTATDMQIIREKCPRSCGLCDWTADCATVQGECTAPPVLDECRACVGVTSGVDIEGRPMAYGQGCPGDAPQNLMAGTNPNMSGASSAGNCARRALAAIVSVAIARMLQ